MVSINQSVVIPTGGDVMRLEWALGGLLRQENAPPFEVLVVPDITEEQWESVGELMLNWCQVMPMLSVVAMERKGDSDDFRAVAARNLGIRFAAGEQVVFLDEDCCPDADFLEAHWAARSHVAYGFRRYFHETKITPYPGSIEDAHLRMYSAGDVRRSFAHTEAAHWYACNASCPRWLLMQVGGFDETQPEQWGNEDIQLACRLRDYGATFQKLGELGYVTHFDHPRRERRPDFKETYMSCIRGEYPVMAPSGPLLSAKG